MMQDKEVRGFSKCPNKENGKKYLQDFDGTCYDCHIENSLLFQECRNYCDLLRELHQANQRGKDLEIRNDNLNIRIVGLAQELIVEQEKNRVAVEALEEIKVNDYDKIGLYDDELEDQIDRLTGLATQALAKLRKE